MPCAPTAHVLHFPYGPIAPMSHTPVHSVPHCPMCPITHVPSTPVPHCQLWSHCPCALYPMYSTAHVPYCPCTPYPCTHTPLLMRPIAHVPHHACPHLDLCIIKVHTYIGYMSYVPLDSHLDP